MNMNPSKSFDSGNHHITFDEVSKQVHHLRDVILSDIQRGFDRSSQCQDSEEINFTNHQMFTKYWFLRISSVNKKRFCLILLRDISCAWTLSLVLKSIWNSRTKDAVASKYEIPIWSSYDVTPMDHNRSAVPLEILVDVMEGDRKYFRSLEPSSQAEFLLELLQLAGGPIVRAIFNKAQTIFEHYQEDQLHNIQEIAAVIENQETRSIGRTNNGDDKTKKDIKKHSPGGGDGSHQKEQQDALLQLEMCLAQWKSLIKSVKDTQKLEEVEMVFSDGTKKRIWKVNRPKPEVTETMDYLQLLPQAVAKMILSFVPSAQLADCAKVNRYWAYLVDEFKAELAARIKIDLDIEKLTEAMLRYDTINDQSMMTFRTMTETSYTLPLSHTFKKNGCYSKHASQKSGATNLFKRVLRDQKIKLPPIRNLKELSERLDRRGAADDNLREWCKTVLKRYNPGAAKDRGFHLPVLNPRMSMDGVIDLGDITFPCPLMSMDVQLPLKPALTKDPTNTAQKQKKSNICASKINLEMLIKKGKRYDLWSRDFSSLYTASKIPSYKSPV